MCLTSEFRTSEILSCPVSSTRNWSRHGNQCVTFLCFFVLLLAHKNAFPDSVIQAQAQRIVAQYSGVFTAPPTWPNASETPDGPLLGNGDLGVVVTGNIDHMTLVMDKNEFWSLNEGQVKAMASMSLSIPGMAGATYSMKQSIGSGEVSGQFEVGANQLTTTSWVQSTDTANNLFFTQFHYSGGATQVVTVSLTRGKDNPNPVSTANVGNVLLFNVAADSVSTVDGFNTHQVQIAVGVVGTKATIVNGNQLQFTLTPGSTITLASSVMSNYDNVNYKAQSLTNIKNLTTGTISNLNLSHKNWWASFWAKSFVEIPNKTVEKEYYGSLYLLASCSREGEAPPGLWGNWIQEDTAWNSDYTLNYNYETPFYAAFPTNHVELATSYDTPVKNWVPNAEAEAKSNGWSGAFYRVHIGPLPNGSRDNDVHNQKFNGAFAATVMLMHYYYTRDATYANSIYPTLKQMATFWQNYLSWNGTSYDVLQDAQNEDDTYPQTNGVMSLGLVKFLLQGVIDISTSLNVDSSTRAIWQTELNAISPFPTFLMNGKEVFRYTSDGREWDTGNAIGIQHIYPASQIGLATRSSTLQLARNMVDQMARWDDGNGTVTFYPAAARVGYNPSAILSHLTSWITANAYSNFHIHTGGGGVENLNTAPSTVDEMLMQSFQGNIIVFPNWPSGTDGQFGDLLAYGNFLVSSSRLNGSVKYIRVTSQSGLSVSLTNPWHGKAVQLYRNGSNTGTVSGTKLIIPTEINDVLLLAPAGTSYDAILAEMGSALPVPPPSPFNGAPVGIPGTVQAENYDLGGLGAAYNIETPNNIGVYRTDGVNIEPTEDAGGGYDVGFTNSGQYFRYTVKVLTAATYTVSLRVAGPDAVTDILHLSKPDGTDLSGPINMPATGGWQTFANVTATVNLPAGLQTLVVAQDNGGWNFNYFSIVPKPRLISAAAQQ